MLWRPPPARQLRIRWGHFGLAAAIVLIVAIVLIIVNLEPSDTAPRFVLDMGDLEEGLTPGRGGALSPSPSALIVKTSPITVKGRISPETMISLNGNRLELDQDGNFQTPVSLVLGENRLIFMIITTNGEEETLERVVIFEP